VSLKPFPKPGGNKNLMPDFFLIKLSEVTDQVKEVSVTPLKKLIQNNIISPL